MLLVNWKNELKIIVLSENGNVNVNDNDNATNIIFNITDTKLYVPVVNFLARDNQKLSKLLSKGFKRSVYWNEYKTKVRIKIRQISFLNQISLESLDYLF